jgi:hypothetical protein
MKREALHLLAHWPQVLAFYTAQRHLSTLPGRQQSAPSLHF